MKKFLVVLFLLIASSSLFGQAFVQAGGTGTPASGSSCNSCVSNTVAFSSNEGANHLILAMNEELYPNSSPTQNPTISDTAGNAWVKLYSSCSINWIPGTIQCSDLYATCSSVAGANTIKFTQPGGNTNTWMITTSEEYSGVVGNVSNACVISSQPLPRPACTGGCGPTSNSDVRTVGSGVLLIAISTANENSTAPTTNFTANRVYALDASVATSITMSEKITSSAGTQQASWTYGANTGSWQVLMFGFGASPTVGPLKKRAIIF